MNSYERRVKIKKEFIKEIEVNKVVTFEHESRGFESFHRQSTFELGSLGLTAKPFSK